VANDGEAESWLVTAMLKVALGMIILKGLLISCPYGEFSDFPYDG
jgi:hypothetical protein